MSEQTPPKAPPRPSPRPGAQGAAEGGLSRVRPGTWVLVGLCIAAVGVAWLDPGVHADEGLDSVSSRSASRRVFPELGDRDVTRATIEFQGVDGPLVRLVPNPEGQHGLMRGDELLGPVDPEALASIWDSLRVATTLRAVPRGTDVGAGQRGVVRISFPDETMTLSLGRDAPDQSGVYGVLEEGEPWVVESEIAWLVDQKADAWLARRVLPLEAAEVAGLAWGEDLTLGRGDDDLWRVVTGTHPWLLSNGAVDLRLNRLLAARLEPLVPRAEIEADALRPWLTVTSREGRTHTVLLGDPCPGDKALRIIDRGPGLLGCIDASVVEPWPIVPLGEGMLEPRLVPYDYGRVLSIEQQEPEPRTLRRRSGGWLVVDDDGRREVSEDEVFRWYGDLRELEVEQLPLEAAAGLELRPDHELLIETDSTQTLRLMCERVREVGKADALLCARDDAPPVRVVGGMADLAFDQGTFADRRLLALRSSDVRALEIQPGPDSADVRQSLHQDLGVWRLDAPAHPDGDGAMDEVRLEALLAALGSARAQAWVGVPDTAPRRTLTVDMSPSGDDPARYALELHDGCVAVVAGHQPAQLDEGTCEVLGGDLLFDDPVRYWLKNSRSVAIKAATADDDDAGRVYRRKGQGWETSEGRALGASDLAVFDQLEAWRSSGISAGEPSTPSQREITIRRNEGPTVVVDMGEGWARVRDAPWYYAHARD